MYVALVKNIWMYNSNLELNYGDNKILMEILSYIDLNKAITYPFRELDVNISSLEEDERNSISKSFVPFEYYILSLQLSHPYID